MFPHGLMFHHFNNDQHKGGQGAISAETLARLLTLIGPERILSANDWCHRASRGTLQQSDLCITFDDSLLCQFDIALPVLEHFNKTAFWFVYSSVFQDIPEPFEIYRHFRTTQYTKIDDFYEEFFCICSKVFPAMTRKGLDTFDSSSYLLTSHFYSEADRKFRFFRDEVLGPEKYHFLMSKILDSHQINEKNLCKAIWMTNSHLQHLHSRGHVIGLHSYTHPTRLSTYPIAEQKSEYEKNAIHLKQVLGCSPIAMSHPNNSYTSETLDILIQMGITVGFRANMAALDCRSVLEFPREDHANLIRKYEISL